MEVTFCCPHCEHTSRVRLAPASGQPHAHGESTVAPPTTDGQSSEGEIWNCPVCDGEVGRHDADRAARRPDGGLERCLVCAGTELFLRKDFPQRLGAAIVVSGFLASCVTWYFRWIYLTFGVLFATALVDLVLYLIVGDALVCYRCGAHYHGVEHSKGHSAFDLATHERYRQQAARLASANTAGGPNLAKSGPMTSSPRTPDATNS